MHNSKLQKQQRGLTLIELLVALVLGVTVILGVSQGLMSMSLSSRIQNDNARLQGDADSALSFIAFKIKNSISTPCERLALLNKSTDKLTIHDLEGSATSSGGATETINATQATAITEMLKGQGMAITQRNVSGSIGNVATPSTDDITLVSAEERFYTSDDVTYESDSVSIDGKFPSARGSNETLYAITDCAYMDVFRANRSESGSKTTLTFDNAMKRKYPAKSSMVSVLDVSQIRVDNQKRLINQTLFKRSPGPLMDNVELIRVLFGVDNDFDGITDQYVTSSQLDTLGSVDIVSADIYMMIRIPGKNNDVPESYKLYMPNTSAGSNAGAMQEFEITDQVKRRVYTQSVAFRNNAVIYK